MKDYKRLTERTKHGIAVLDDGERFVLSCGGYVTTKALNRLAELEDKIENGMLIEVESPCTEEESDYICKYYENGLCRCGEEIFGTPPQPCHHIYDFENCTCSRPIEDKKEQKIRITLKEIKQDAITQFVNLVNKKLDYYDRRSIKLSAFYLSSMMKEALHELRYEG